MRSVNLAPVANRLMRPLAIAAVVAQGGIAVTGSVVRVTGSGLGCPTWPQCFPGSLVPVPHPEVAALNTFIEFTNRTLTGVVVVIAGLCLLAAWYRTPRTRRVVRLALIQPVGVVVQAVVGGMTVLAGLAWWTVGVHFMLSAALVWLAVQLSCAVNGPGGDSSGNDGDGPASPTVPRAVRGLTTLSSVVLVALLYAGTLVTAAGPHSGDAKTPRLGLGVPAMAQLHADLVVAYVGLVVGLGFALRAVGCSARLWRRYLVVVAVVALQGVLGGVQYALGVPEVLVSLHVLGAMLATSAAAALWAGTAAHPRRLAGGSTADHSVEMDHAPSS
jgi:heme a synthase